MSELKPCPCGKIPTSLSIVDSGQGTKWGNAFGSCCNEWSIEFRTYYNDINTDECMQLAVEAWNETTRALSTPDPRIQEMLEVLKILHIEYSNNSQLEVAYQAITQIAERGK